MKKYLNSPPRSRNLSFIAGLKIVDDREIPFGLSIEGDAFCSMRRGELLVIAGRPSVGKSSLMRQMAAYAANRGLGVAIFSLEAGHSDLLRGMISALSGHSAFDSSLNREELVQQRDALEEIMAWPLSVFTEDNTIAAIAERARDVKATGALDVLAVDYLTLMPDCGSCHGAEERVARVTRELKRLAVELDIVVLLVSPLNGDVRREGNRCPGLPDLWSSMNQIADRIIFLHRPDIDPFTKTRQGNMDPVGECPLYGVVLVHGKGRGDGTSTALWFNRRLTRFETPTP
jgi:replicative DNA helicase